MREDVYAGAVRLETLVPGSWFEVAACPRLRGILEMVGVGSAVVRWGRGTHREVVDAATGATEAKVGGRRVETISRGTLVRVVAAELEPEAVGPGEKVARGPSSPGLIAAREKARINRERRKQGLAPLPRARALPSALSRAKKRAATLRGQP